MNIVIAVLSLVTFFVIVLLVYATRRTTEAINRARKAESEVESLKADLSEVRKTASEKRQDLEEARKEQKRVQKELSTSKKKAFKAQRKAEKSMDTGDIAVTIKAWEEAVSKARAESHAAQAERDKWRAKAAEAEKIAAAMKKERGADQRGEERRKAAEESSDAVKPSAVGGEELAQAMEKIQTHEKAVGRLEAKLQKADGRQEQLYGNLDEFKRKLRERDSELLVLKKQKVSSERSYMFMERELELLSARLATLEGRPVEFEVEPVGESLGAPPKRDEDESRRKPARKRRTSTSRRKRGDAGAEGADEKGAEAGSGDKRAEERADSDPAIDLEGWPEANELSKTPVPAKADKGESTQPIVEASEAASKENEQPTS